MTVAQGPAWAAAKDIDFAKINAAIVKDHLLPRYHIFTESTGVLEKATTALCPQVSPDNLKAVRTAFHDAMDAWEEVEHLRQGPPATGEPHIRIKFWPDRKNLVDKHLARLMAGKDANILTPEPFAHTSIAVQGFPAMERLIFAEDAATGLKGGDGPVKPCAVVQAIAVNLHAIASDLEGRWTKDPAVGRPAKRVTTDLFNDLATGLGALAELKLVAFRGTNDKLRPHRVENWMSGRGLRNVTHNLMALEDLYDGLASDPAAGMTDTPEDELIRGQFKQIIKNARELGPSIVAVLKTEKGPLRLKVLKSDILDLRELVIVNLTEAMGLVLGFNSLDGD